MDFPLINNQTLYETVMVVSKKQTSKYEENCIILHSIEIVVIKVRKQGWSSTPADILVGI